MYEVYGFAGSSLSTVTKADAGQNVSKKNTILPKYFTYDVCTLQE